LIDQGHSKQAAMRKYCRLFYFHQRKETATGNGDS
jgi:hypothetical protein